MEVLKLINNGSKKLRDKNINSYKIDSEILLSEVLNQTREKILINLDKKIDTKKIGNFYRFIQRRSSREPIAYILKKKEFWSRSFLVDYNTLIPRPETELLVEKIVKIFKTKNIYVLDIGTGTGCILLSILTELKNSKGVGIDISSKTIRVANANLKKHKLTNRAKFYKRSLDEIYHNKFDLIVSNPPYIMKKDLKNLNEDIKKFEPKLALDGGNDGLDVIKKVIYKSKNILKIKGMLALEIGNEQYRKVSKILIDNNYRIKHVIKDYKDNIRCVFANYK